MNSAITNVTYATSTPTPSPTKQNRLPTSHRTTYKFTLFPSDVFCLADDSNLSVRRGGNPLGFIIKCRKPSRA